MRSNRKMRWAATARLISTYFSAGSPERYFARFAIFIVFATCLVSVALNVWINMISGSLFTALQARNINAFFSALICLAMASVAMIANSLTRLVVRQCLELRWRRWATVHYLQRWTKNNNFYLMRFPDKAVDNPDQRIAEDLKKLVVGTIENAMGIFQSCVSFVSFATILWTLSGTIKIPFWYDWNEKHFSLWCNIAGYLVWVALIYQCFITWLAVKIGWPLIGLDNRQQAREADFRYRLVRMREDADSISLLRGQDFEHDQTTNRFSLIYDVSMKWIFFNARYFTFELLSGQLTSYLPYLVAGPRYFTGAITLGELVQINGAFGSVTGSLGWLIGAFPAIADWRATVDRLLEFDTTMALCEGIQDTLVIQQGAEALAFHADVSLWRPDGGSLLNAATSAFQIEPDEHTAITGVSGSGKSTLLRAFAGLWPYGEGSIGTPAAPASLYLPQKPYFPTGVSLREAVWYPQAAPGAPDLPSEEAHLLRDLDLHHLVSVLDSGASADWCKTLSLGEQQRLSLIRAILLSPKWLFMDEPFSALDKDNQRSAAAFLNEKLNATTIIYVGHSLPLELNIKRHFVLSQQSLKPVSKGALSEEIAA